MSDATRIILTADDRTRAAFASAEGNINRLSQAANGINLDGMRSQFEGLLGAISVGAIAAFSKHLIDAADALNDMSQQIGIGTRELAGWELATSQNGATLESLARGIKALSGNMLENGAALRAAGITAKDASGALIQTADLFKALPDGVEKTTLAVKLFGKAGMELIPLLNQGSEGLRDAQEKAAGYAARIAEVAPKADAFNDQLAEMNLNLKALAYDALSPQMEGLTGLAKWLSDVASGGEKAANALEYLADKGLKGPQQLAAILQGRAGVVNPAAGVKSGWDLIAPEFQPQGSMLPGQNSAAESAAMKKAQDLLKRLGVGNTKAGKDARNPFAFQDNEASTLARVDRNFFGETGTTFELFQKEQEAIDKENESLDKLRAKYEEIANPVKKYADQLVELAELRALFPEQAEQWAKAEDNVVEAMKNMNKEGKNQFADLERAIEGWGKRSAEVLVEWAAGGKATFSDFAASIARDLAVMTAYEGITKPLFSALSSSITGSGGIGGFVKGLFGGARAEGGPVSSGTAYLVGERGPELFVPSGNGSIIPNGAGGGVVQNITIDARGADAGVLARIDVAMARARDEAVAAVAGMAGRGGNYGRAIGRR